MTQNHPATIGEWATGVRTDAGQSGCQTLELKNLLLRKSDPHIRQNEVIILQANMVLSPKSKLHNLAPIAIAQKDASGLVTRQP